MNNETMQIRAEQLASMALLIRDAIVDGVPSNKKEYFPALDLFSELMLDFAKITKNSEGE